MKKFLIALVALLGLSSCAQLENAGAAAVVEDKQISVETVGKQFNEIISDLNGSLKPGTDKSIHRALVSAFIVDELVTMAATELGVAATEAQIQSTKRNYMSMFGGKKAFIQTAAENAIPRSAILQNIRTSANFEAIGIALDPEGNEDSQSNAAITFLLEYGKRVDISVNPRFGKFDLDQFTLVNAPSDATIEWKKLKVALKPN